MQPNESAGRFIMSRVSNGTYFLESALDFLFSFRGRRTAQFEHVVVTGGTERPETSRLWVMARSSRRYPSLQQSAGGVSQAICDPVGMPRARSLLLCLVAAVVVAMVLRMNLSDDSTGGPENLTPAADLTKARVRDISQGDNALAVELTVVDSGGVVVLLKIFR